MSKTRQSKGNKTGRARVRQQAAAAVPSIFAALFMTHPPSIEVEPGYYDAVRQVYISHNTGQPAYVGLKSGDRTRVADTTGSNSNITTMTGNRSSPDDHTDSVQDDFD